MSVCGRVCERDALVDNRKEEKKRKERKKYVYTYSMSQIYCMLFGIERGKKRKKHLRH